MGSDDWPDWLPGDWTVHIKKVGAKKVKCYIGPDGHKCYSKPQVFDYLKRTNRSIPDEKLQNTDGPGIDLSAEPNASNTDIVLESSPAGHRTKLTPRTSRRKSITRVLSEDGLAGVGSSSEPLSHKRHMGDSSWLPAGWTVEDKFRKGGNRSGTKYKIYTDPISGRKFFSKPQVLNYLATTSSSAGGQEAVFAEPINAMPITSWQEKPTTEPDNSQMYEDTDVEKKTESSSLSSDYEVISTTPAEGLPSGWIKEVRMRKSGPTTRQDPYYLDPSGEYVFCSEKDVLSYLESGDLRNCVSRPLFTRNLNNDDTPNANLYSNGGELPSQPDQSKETEASKEFTNGSVDELNTNGSGIEDPKPLRSITGGSFSTPVKGSFVAPKEDTDWLPDGWLVDVRYKSSGVKYKIYKDPATGKLFYSKPQVLSYLGGNVGSSYSSKKRKEHNSSVAPDSSPNSTPADVTHPKKRRRKKAKSENSEYQEVITTSAADGLPAGWIKETRAKVYATHTRSDPFYTDPATGYIFRSKVDALRFLETGDVNLCSSRPKVRNKDGNEVFVHTTNVQKPTTGNDVATKVPKVNHTPSKGSRPATNSPAGSAKGQKGKDPETAPASSVPTKGNGAGQEKHDTGVNLEKEPDDGNLAFDIPEDDNWTDHCIDFAVKTLADEIVFKPISGGEFQEENTSAKETPTKVN